MKRTNLLTRRRLLGTSTVAMAAVLLSGCGFQLRGSGSMPDLPPMALEGSINTPLAYRLRSRLKQLGSPVAADAPWRLTLGSPALQQRRIGSDGRASGEYELTLGVPVSVQQRSNDAYALNHATVSSSMRIRVSNDDLLNRDTTFREAEQTLTVELTQQIIDRLANLEALR